MLELIKLSNQLQPADVVIAKKKNGLGRILNHYIVYVGNNTFIGNLKEGVKTLSYIELKELLIKYKPTQIRHFSGSETQRNQAINRAYSKLGKKYNLFTYNCEHFANWVQNGKENSTQVNIGLAALFVGITYKLITVNNGKR